MKAEKTGINNRVTVPLCFLLNSKFNLNHCFVRLAAVKQILPNSTLKNYTKYLQNTHWTNKLALQRTMPFINHMDQLWGYYGNLKWKTWIYLLKRHLLFFHSKDLWTIARKIIITVIIDPLWIKISQSLLSWQPNINSLCCISVLIMTWKETFNFSMLWGSRTVYWYLEWSQPVSAF